MRQLSPEDGQLRKKLLPQEKNKENKNLSLKRRIGKPRKNTYSSRLGQRPKSKIKNN